MARRLLLLLILFFALVPRLMAQERSSSSAKAPAAQGEDSQPVEYSQDEFPGWLNDLRRAEIVALGSFPLTYLFSSLSVDVYRYGAHDFAPEYAPAILGSPTRADLSTTEKYNVLIGAVAGSLSIALVDYFLGLTEK